MKKTFAWTLIILCLLTIIYFAIRIHKRQVTSPSVVEENVVSSSALTVTATPESTQEPEHKRIKPMKICDLRNCLRDYFTVRAELTTGEKRAVELGKIPGGKKISYVEVKKNRIPENELRKYKIGKVNFLSSLEQCDNVLGIPEKKSKLERRYRYKSDYEICLAFSKKGKITKMGIYKGSREQAKKTYQVGDFTMMACRLIKYNKDYQQEEKVTFPEDTIAVAYHAFAVDKKRYTEPKTARDFGKVHSGWKKMTLCIPKDVYLEPEAFAFLGPVDITFEPGRTEIEPGAFMYAGSYPYWGCTSMVRLPDSVKVLKKFALYQVYNKNMEFILNNGLEEIEDFALQGAKCDLPDTIKRVGKSALYDWHPIHKFSLPENLEELGNNAIYITSDVGEKIKEPIYIPRSVKKVGINPICYEELLKRTCGVKVDSQNKSFKSDENGWLYSKDGKILYFAFCTEEKMILPKGLEKIKCRLQLADHETTWQKVIFPKTITKKEYNEFCRKHGL